MFLALVDYETNKEKIIWSRSEPKISRDQPFPSSNSPSFTYTFNTKDGGAIAVSTMPYVKHSNRKIDPQITTIGDNLILVNPSNNMMKIFDFNGKLKGEKILDLEEKFLSVEKQKAIQRKAIERYTEYLKNNDEKVQKYKEGFQKIIHEMIRDVDRIKNPIRKPSFTNIIKDSDDNILFFEMPELKGDNSFKVWVFKEEGKFVTQCRFVCDNYNLNISSSKMIFRDGYLYALQVKSNENGNPLRLVKFKLE
jgi:hypothetical protein